jgi:hypothetical protein
LDCVAYWRNAPPAGGVPRRPRQNRSVLGSGRDRAIARRRGDGGALGNASAACSHRRTARLRAGRGSVRVREIKVHPTEALRSMKVLPECEGLRVVAYGHASVYDSDADAVEAARPPDQRTPIPALIVSVMLREGLVVRAVRLRGESCRSSRTTHRAETPRSQSLVPLPLSRSGSDDGGDSARTEECSGKLRLGGQYACVTVGCRRDASTSVQTAR